MNVQVIKRDGRAVSYNEDKIYAAIQKAFLEVFPRENLGNTVASIVGNISSEIEEMELGVISIEEIQDLVIYELLQSPYNEVAANYISYKTEKSIRRIQKSDMEKQLQKLVERDEAVIHENANKDSKVFNTQRDLTAGIAAKVIGLKMLPPHVANAHEKGDIHYHDLDYQPYAPMSNCFDASVKFVTEKGVLPFSDFKDGDAVKVIDHTGQWKNAVVRNYGEQWLNNVTFKRNGKSSMDVLVTGNHRWILKDASETTELKVGDTVYDTPLPDFDIAKMTDEEKTFFVKGFVFGDGSLYSKNGSRVRLCGDKTKFETLFSEVGFTTYSPDYLNGDILATNYQMPKEPLSGEETIAEITAFINGYIEADGSYRNGRTDFKAIITASREEYIACLSKFSAVAKYFISGTDDLTGKETNYGTRKETTTFRFVQGNRCGWKVNAIQENVKKAEVWCLEVEDTHSFILDGGIVTGNCCLVDFKYMFENGFSIGNAEVEKPRSINTAAAQMAQIIANVASSQYGLR